MNHRWAPAFTVVELIVVVVVIGVIATVSILGYNGVQRQAATRAVQSDLNNAMTEMQLVYRDTGSYPTSVPSSVQTSDHNTLSIANSFTEPHYEYLTTVQKGVLLSDICNDMVADGKGQGKNNGGGTENYVVACGNWNRTSMQIEAWETKQWNTPISKSTLTSYANSYVSHDQQWNPNADDVVHAFYLEMVSTYERQGGTFPVQSFWDSWAAPGNGGTMYENLPTPTIQSTFCLEGTSERYPEILWHFTDEMRLEQGACS